MQMPCLFVWVLALSRGAASLGVRAAASYESYEAHANSCDVDPLVRPVIIVHGYRGGFLFDSAANYKIEWVDEEDTAPGNEGRGVGDLDLPLTWNSFNLTQDQSSVGPERFDGDDIPDLFLPDGTLIPIAQAVFSDLVDIVREWEASPAANGKRLLYSVAYDWRRDVWEQSERVVKVVDQVIQQTGCKPIIVPHSLGGVVVYSGFARFGKAFADKVHGVFYGASPAQPVFASISSFIEGEEAQSGPSGAPDTQFTFASLFNVVPSAAGTCADTPPLLDPAAPAASTAQPCGPRDIPTGLTCNSSACGRPDDWPPGEPFYLNVDMHDPLTWQVFGFGLPLARALRGFPEETLPYSEEELEHLALALQTSARINEARIGTAGGDLSAAAAVADIHPPAVQLAPHLTDVEVPGEGTRDFREPSSFECVPAPTFGLSGAVQCVDFLPAVPQASDGLLNSQSLTFKYPELFGPKLQIINTTAPSPLWQFLAAVDPAASVELSPHVTVYQARRSAPGEFVDCREFPARIEFDTASGEYPALEALLCSLVVQGSGLADDDVGGDAAAAGGSYGEA